MKIIITLCSAVCFFTLNAQSLAQERGELPPYVHYGSEKAASIDAFVAQYQTAWRELDADLFANLHSKDTEWTNAFARIFRGRKELKGFVDKRLFPQFAQMQSAIDSLTLKPISSRSLSGSVTVLHLYTDFGSAADPSSRRVHFHLVLNKNKNKDQWEIVHTAIMDPRQ